MKPLKILNDILLNIYKYYTDEFDDVNKVLAQYQKEKELINMDPVIKKAHYAYKQEVLEDDLEKINKIALDVKTFWTAWNDIKGNLKELLEECVKRKYDTELQILLKSMINYMENAYEDFGILRYDIKPMYGSLPKIKNIIESLRMQILYYIDQLKKFGIANEYSINYYLKDILENEGINDTLLKFEDFMQLDLPEYNNEDIIEPNPQIYK